MNKKFRNNKNYFYMIGKDIIYEGTGKEISLESGISMHCLRTLFYRHYKNEIQFKKNKSDYKCLILEEDLSAFLDSDNYEPKQFSLYKGNNILATGSIEEIAKQIGVNEKMVYYYGTNRYVNRSKGNSRVLVALD